MRHMKHSTLAFISLIFLTGVPRELSAAVKLPAIISDNMVLQAGISSRIWGTADPGENIEVLFAGQGKKAAADLSGRWSVELDPMKASPESATLIVTGKNRLEVKNVLVGEVWLGSGQSNMAFPLNGALNAGDEIAKANYPLIRLFTVKQAISSQPQEDCEGKWEICSSGTAGDFSAVMYFFARELYKAYALPVGLISSSVGNTTIQVWMSREAIEANPEFGRLPGVPAANYMSLQGYNEYRKAIIGKAAWKDSGNQGEVEGWGKPEADTAGWTKVSMPQTMERLFGNDFDGAAWIRREVELPAAWAGKDLYVRFGPTRSAMTVYFNGENVFSSNASMDEYSPTARMPAKLAKAGENLLAIRYFNDIGSGGDIWGNPDVFMIRGPGGESLPLAGTWLGKVERRLEPAKMPDNTPLPLRMPCAFYNGMIAPVLDYSRRGTLWNQGESNAGDLQYAKMLQALIKSWRARARSPEMPFFFCQSANYGRRHAEPVDTAWARLREAQRETLAVPGTGMAVAIDIGDSMDIHPKNKQEVGRRLALWARHCCYGEKGLECSGPLLESVEHKDGALLLKFSHVKGGLVAQGGELRGFALSEDGKNYVWAQAKITGDCVLASNPSLKSPKAVRYAWDTNPESTLYNGEGLPASPFEAFATNDDLPIGFFANGSLDGWQLHLGAEFPPGARGNLVVVEDATAPSGHVVGMEGAFEMGGVYVAMHRRLTTPIPFRAVKLKVKTADFNRLTIQLKDSTGQYHQQRIKLAD